MVRVWEEGVDEKWVAPVCWICASQFPSRRRIVTPSSSLHIRFTGVLIGPPFWCLVTPFSQKSEKE